jgi:hypothetical protein
MRLFELTSGRGRARAWLARGLQLRGSPSMSELAFDANGEPITFPVGVEELTVRRFRNPGVRGACEVVHDREGAPLYVPVETSYVEFRALVDAVPGRYSLDPVDLGRKSIANTAPAYVTLTEPVRNVAALGAADDRDSVIRELVRANVEMTRRSPIVWRRHARGCRASARG